MLHIYIYIYDISRLRVKQNYDKLAEHPSVQRTVVLLVTVVPRTYFQYIDRFSACGMMRNGQMLCLQVSVVSVLRYQPITESGCHILGYKNVHNIIVFQWFIA